MNKTKGKNALIFGALGAIVLVFVGLLVGGVFAFPMGMHSQLSTDSAVATALQNGDYQGYLNAIEANWQSYKASITQDKFNQMSQQYNNRSTQISTMQANKKAVDQAIQDGNYQEWVTAITALNKKSSFADKITADNFATYVKMYQAEQSKDWTSAKQYAQDLGIQTGMQFGFGGHRNFMNSKTAITPVSS